MTAIFLDGDMRWNQCLRKEKEFAMWYILAFSNPVQNAQHH